jgi:hypothetical protein
MFTHHNKRNNVIPAILAVAAGIAGVIFFKRFRDDFEDRSTMNRLRKQIIAKLSDVSDLTREKYDSVVDEVVSNYGRIRDISKNELMDLADDLKLHWNRIKDAWNKDTTFRI